MLEIILLITVFCLGAYVVYSTYKQKKFNKSLADSVFNTVQTLDAVSKEGAAVAGLAQALSEETLSLNSQSVQTRKLCLEIIENNDRLASAVEMLIKNQKTTTTNVNRIASAFNKKAEADKKFVETLNEYVSRHVDEEEPESDPFTKWDGKSKKTLN